MTRRCELSRSAVGGTAKPISWDVIEGQAMVAAARKYGSTVQVSLQRWSTPHLLEARDRFLRSGKLGKIGYVDIHSYYGGPGAFPPTEESPEHLDSEKGRVTGDEEANRRLLRKYRGDWVHPTPENV